MTAELRVVATAGHVDHGKSSLIQRLTGMDPDRFAEEKRRGLTIDLGYAWCTLPSGREIGFVDVPGHERFVRNMLAGVGPVRLVLFVVAADEGWKPQSEEHLQIVDVLGAAFYLMEPIDGFNASTGVPEPHASDPALQRSMGLSMADAIAALGRVDFRAVGLGDLGKPDGWLERQVERWRSHLRSYDAIEGYRGAQIPGVEQVAAWLDDLDRVTAGGQPSEVKDRTKEVRPGGRAGERRFAPARLDPRRWTTGTRIRR